MERRNRSFLLILLFLVGGVPAELKRAVVVAVAPTPVFIGKRFENTKEIKQ
jgi:hypothetical protein